MRLNVFLSLSVAMSRNQAKFFIQKGRLSVDGNVVTDPYFEVPDDSLVTFDGKPISIASHRYIVLHKPPAYACTTRDSTLPSVLSLLQDRKDDDYFYFANVLGPEQTGLVLLSNDARWANRMKRRLLTKPRVFVVHSPQAVADEQLQTVAEQWEASPDDRAAPTLTAEREDRRSLRLKTARLDIPVILETLGSAGISVDTLHLQQIGRLQLDDLDVGRYADLSEDDIKV
ncbi:MAG: S4 domain-containing protein [Pseudomonadota bacterium]